MSAPVWTMSSGRWATWLAFGVLVSATTLAWLGYRAISEWQARAALLAQRNADAAVDLLLTGITRDMRAVQATVLTALDFDAVRAAATLDLNALNSTFARYPYPDAFFSGRGDRSDGLTFYSRADRAPFWLPRKDGGTTFPVRRQTAAAASTAVMTRLRRDANPGRRFAAFDIHLEGRTLQVVALLEYTDTAREALDTVVGFVVDREWVAGHYFGSITAQVERMSGADSGVRLAVLDGTNRPVAGTAADGVDAPASRRRFPLLFFDPTIVEVDPPADLKRELWTATAIVSGDRALIAARLGARRTLLLVAGSALALAGGLILMVRADQATTRLADLRSAFVSAVTHELKTPLASIRALSETLAAGRSSHPEMAKEYAQMAVHEAKRLTRLIDNLLAYSRISDVAEAYTFEPIALEDLVRHGLREFSSQLSVSRFTVELDFPAGLLPVRADRTSMLLALANVIDNAIRYSETTRWLRLSMRAIDSMVRLEIQDAGCGIPADELPQVTRRFFRGHRESPGGSGLGLSITQRIVGDHGGHFAIRSEVGAGTTVAITLPTARIDHEEAHPDR